MADRLTLIERSKNMSAIRSKDMLPEMRVRRWLHAAGYRYRLHGKDLPGKPDIVFRSRRKVIFVHGCFWHQHEESNCLDGRLPKSRVGYWSEKLAGNVRRDRVNKDKLAGAGWSSLIVWECETKNMEAIGEVLRAFLGAPNRG